MENVKIILKVDDNIYRCAVCNSYFWLNEKAARHCEQQHACKHKNITYKMEPYDYDSVFYVVKKCITCDIEIESFKFPTHWDDDLIFHKMIFDYLKEKHASI